VKNWWLTDPDILALGDDEVRNPPDAPGQMMMFKQSMERKLQLLRKTDKLVRNVKRYFDHGQEGLDWYEHTFFRIAALLGSEDNAVFFCRLLAATSPRCAIVENVRRALRIYDAVRRKKRFRVNFPGHQKNVQRVLKGEPLSGPKVQAFEKNLLPEQYGGDPTVVTVDIWMMRAFNRPSDAPNMAEYRGITKIVRGLAMEEKVEARQYQAAVWVGIKKLEGDPSDTSEPFEVALEREMDRPPERGLFDNEQDDDGIPHAKKAEHVAEQPEYDIYKALRAGAGEDPLYDPALAKMAHIDEPGAFDE
jgi:hypothetical protein